MNRTHSEHRLARLRVPFVIPAVAPIPPQPAEGPFHHPAPRQLYETLAPGRTTDDLDPIPCPDFLQPAVEPVIAILAVGPHQLQAAGVFSLEPLQDFRRRRPVV